MGANSHRTIEEEEDFFSSDYDFGRGVPSLSKRPLPPELSSDEEDKSKQIPRLDESISDNSFTINLIDLIKVI